MTDEQLDVVPLGDVQIAALDRITTSILMHSAEGEEAAHTIAQATKRLIGDFRQLQRENQQLRDGLLEIYQLLSVSVNDDRGGIRSGTAYFDEQDIRPIEKSLGIPRPDGET